MNKYNVQLFLVNDCILAGKTQIYETARQATGGRSRFLSSALAFAITPVCYNGPCAVKPFTVRGPLLLLWLRFYIGFGIKDFRLL